jgi:transketolase
MTQTMTSTAAELAEYARQIRVQILKAVYVARAGHIGGPLSAADMLSVLYFGVMDIDPENPTDPDRDRFVLSKGHSSIALYATLALRGYFPVDELKTFDSVDSRLQGHPDQTVTPGVDMSSGSLGLGFAGALGIALGARAAGKDFTTYVMLGDGECNEGVVWEGAHVAARYGLDNIIALIDHNKLQQFGWTGASLDERISPYLGDQLANRWRAFDWKVIEVDGHDVAAILGAVDEAKTIEGMPVAIVAHTVKGKGVSFMENQPGWHSKVPTDQELADALRELGEPEGGAQ